MFNILADAYRANSQDQWISHLLERLAQAEERKGGLSPTGEIDEQRTDQDNSGSEWSFSNNDLPTPLSPSRTINSSHLLSPPVQNDAFQGNPTPRISLEKTYFEKSETPGSHQELTPITQEQRARYVKRTPFSCEESQPPLPDLLFVAKPTEPGEIMPFLEFFFQYPVTLFPIICDIATYAMASTIVSTGFQDDLPSCLILLTLSLSKAYKASASQESGLSDFQRAIYLLTRLSARYTLEYAQAQVLAALFLFKKGRVLGFYSYLHAGCTTLYTMIMRDERSGLEKNSEDTKTTLRLYWITYNLERDLNSEIDSFPKSLLYLLEHRLQLPLGCDEPNTTHLMAPVRNTYTFFLAEMSLKAIIARILTTPNLEHSIQKTFHGTVEMSPLIQEFQTQLEKWEISVPAFLGWFPEPNRGMISPVGARLKLLYWFARFSLFKPLVARVLGESSCTLPLLGWTAFREGLLGGLNMVKGAVEEESDIDVIMGNR
ncbi:hypothetical protein LAWI1_G001127 [Lachnellula willkommii]|uniref:Transcription factor domain-containing protein n=1 Tax=Lachnellula willkommii TaxID=215461 RepID=A0A559MKA1_9HELO|nr:hypothetical protein LAWI1_G001127 [Lachnellula willkommii]